MSLSDDVVLETFKRGWAAPNGEGFYVGRPHPPYTEVSQSNKKPSLTPYYRLLLVLVVGGLGEGCSEHR